MITSSLPSATPSGPQSKHIKIEPDMTIPSLRLVKSEEDFSIDLTTPPHSRVPFETHVKTCILSEGDYMEGDQWVDLEPMSGTVDELESLTPTFWLDKNVTSEVVYQGDPISVTSQLKRASQHPCY